MAPKRHRGEAGSSRAPREPSPPHEPEPQQPPNPFPPPTDLNPDPDFPQVVFRDLAQKGLAAVVFDQTKTMPDVYGAFYDVACMMKSKVDKRDPNATKTLGRIDAIQKICRDSGTLKIRKLHIKRTKSSYTLNMFMVFLALLAISLYIWQSNRTISY